MSEGAAGSADPLALAMEAQRRSTLERERAVEGERARRLSLTDEAVAAAGPERRRSVSAATDAAEAERARRLAEAVEFGECRGGAAAVAASAVAAAASA